MRRSDTISATTRNLLAATFPLIFAGVLTGCGTAIEYRPIRPDRIPDVATWFVTFRYEQGFQIDSVPDGTREGGTVSWEGRTEGELRLRDEIAFSLRADHGIHVTESPVEADGIIALVPISEGLFASGWTGFDVHLLDASGEEQLARIRVRPRADDKDEMIRKAAETIAAIIR